MVELYDLLSGLGLPVSYRYFKNPQTPPYIIYLFSDNDSFGADDKVYSNAENYRVELYTTKKDLPSERLLEGLFNSNDIFYDKTEMYIKSEGLYEVLYEIQL